jgi:hypothetical protein
MVDCSKFEANAGKNKKYNGCRLLGGMDGAGDMKLPV